MESLHHGSPTHKRQSGLEFKLARIRRGLHLYELARQVGISPARLSQYEGGHRQMPAHVEAKLRSLLGLAPPRREGDDAPDAPGTAGGVR